MILFQVDKNMTNKNIETCVFCQLNKDLILLETSHSILVANYFPLGSLSLLAIPKRHIQSITDLSTKETIDLMGIITLATRKIKTKAKPEGINIFTNEGEIAGQTIPHLHFHIVARNNDDGLENFKRKGEKKTITPEELKLIKGYFKKEAF